MSTIKSNVVDYLSQIESLTKTNLQILKTINDSFFTKKNHLYVEVDDATYVIPSFISLENKINMLQENFENLVKSPETSEAYFNFDGNTRAIEVRKYNYAPDSITLSPITTYNVESNDIFKDFMTPVPFVNFELPELPNDITEVNVKKIIAKSDSLKALFNSKLETIGENGISEHLKSVNETYGTIYKFISNFEEDVDYVEYDTIYKLPIRKNIGSGTYTIESVVSDVIDDNLNELITLKLKEKLTYKTFNEAIEKYLQIGDELTNFDGTGKVAITNINPSKNTITVRVVNGEYLNFIGTDTYDTNNDTDIHDLSKLRFFAAVDFNDDKYIKVPLEEDRYVFIAIAPVNSRMNLQSSWGKGLIIDTFSLTNNNVDFNTYYNTNVKNIGDVLFEMTSMITSPITSLSKDEFIRLTNIKPVLNSTDLSVMHINKHLNDSTTARNIREAYNQKKTAESELNEVQEKINDINSKLSSISFDDSQGIRQNYTSQLISLTDQKNSILATINNAINSISINVNSAEIPIENAKYRIRGFYVPNVEISNHVIGIQVQYRYKNISAITGNAVSINENYIYSDWNVLNTFNKNKIATFNDLNGTFTYSYESSNESKNEPSYNQIDIPISQGEVVDIRVKVIYDFGQPYITMSSDWSNVITIPFPEEFAKDVQILSIIDENNNDIKANKFNSILETSGVNAHVSDTIVDQNVTYYHKPDSIASGFYTDERRIIPLKDKLISLSNDIAELKTDIRDASGSCIVSVSIGDENNILYSDRENIINLESYNSFTALKVSEVNTGQLAASFNEVAESVHNNIITNKLINGSYTLADSKVSTMLNISIHNNGSTAMKLYSVFPGNRNVLINDSKSTYMNKDNYSYINENNKKPGGVWFRYAVGKLSSIIRCPECSSVIENEPTDATELKTINDKSLQTQNQFITFRINDAWNGESYYTKDSTIDGPTQNLMDIDNVTNDTNGMVIYPYLSSKYGLCIDSDDPRSYVVINPGEEINIPIYCEYNITKDDGTTMIEKTLSFDLRTSLYRDPVNYSFKVVAKKETTPLDKLSSINKKYSTNKIISAQKYSSPI